MIAYYGELGDATRNLFSAQRASILRTMDSSIYREKIRHLCEDVNFYPFINRFKHILNGSEYEQRIAIHYTKNCSTEERDAFFDGSATADALKGELTSDLLHIDCNCPLPYRLLSL